MGGMAGNTAARGPAWEHGCTCFLEDSHLRPRFFPGVENYVRSALLALALQSEARHIIAHLSIQASALISETPRGGQEGGLGGTSNRAGPTHGQVALDGHDASIIWASRGSLLMHAYRMILAASRTRLPVGRCWCVHGSIGLRIIFTSFPSSSHPINYAKGPLEASCPTALSAHGGTVVMHGPAGMGHGHGAWAGWGAG